jgi:hypothetical protein
MRFSPSMTQQLLLTVVALFVVSTPAFLLPSPNKGFASISSSAASRIVLCSSSSSSSGTELSASSTSPPPPPVAGFIKTISKQGSNKAVQLGDIATVKYSCYLPDNEKAAPFAKAEKQKMVSDRMNLLSTIVPNVYAD